MARKRPSIATSEFQKRREQVLKSLKDAVGIVFAGDGGGDLLGLLGDNRVVRVSPLACHAPVTHPLRTVTHQQQLLRSVTASEVWRSARARRPCRPEPHAC